MATSERGKGSVGCKGTSGRPKGVALFAAARLGQRVPTRPRQQGRQAGWRFRLSPLTPICLPPLPTIISLYVTILVLASDRNYIFYL